MAQLPPPPVKFLLSHPAHFVACGMGSGLSPVAPGTFGTLFSLLTYLPLRSVMPDDMVFMVFLALAFAGGVVACHITGRHLGIVDHGAIVWDEIVPFWTVLLFTPPGLLWLLGAFLVFRFFDILKPQPARFFDTKIKNGFGVMMDDAVAAGYSILTLALIKMALDSTV